MLILEDDAFRLTSLLSAVIVWTIFAMLLSLYAVLAELRVWKIRCWIQIKFFFSLILCRHALEFEESFVTKFMDLIYSAYYTFQVLICTAINLKI